MTYYDNKNDNLTSYRTTNQVFNRFTLGNVINSPGYDSAKTTVLYLYGLTQQLSTAGVQDVISAYKTNGNYNLIMFSMPVYSYVFPVSTSINLNDLYFNNYNFVSNRILSSLVKLSVMQPI